jgi:putative ABC transport system ATP-binding protein
VTEQETAIIQTIDLCKVYGSGDYPIKALDGVSLTIQSGKFVAIMGPSGSGKSTMMNILGCLDRPTSGRYFLAGEDVSDLNKVQLAQIRNRRLGFVFQSYNLLPRTSALENVILPLIYSTNGSGIPEEQQRDRAMAMLEMVGLADRASHQPQELSGGQAQRVAIARALINDPALILADEPTGNLDSKSGNEIMALLSELHRQGRTIVMVTHDPEIAAYAERVIHFLDGRIEVETLNGRSGDHAGQTIDATPHLENGAQVSTEGD